MQTCKEGGLIEEANQALFNTYVLGLISEDEDDSPWWKKIIDIGKKIVDVCEIIAKIITILGDVQVPLGTTLPESITQDFDPAGEITIDNVQQFLDYYLFVLENDYLIPNSYTKEQSDTAFLTKTQATNTYLTSTDAANTYLTPNNINNLVIPNNANNLVRQSQIISSTTNLINEISISISNGDTRIIDSTTPIYTPESTFTSENNNCVLAAFSEDTKELHLYHSGNDSAFNNFVPRFYSNYRAVIININENVNSYNAQIKLKLSGFQESIIDDIPLLPNLNPSGIDLSNWNVVLAPENKMVVSKKLNDATFTGNNYYTGNNTIGRLDNNSTTTFKGLTSFEGTRSEFNNVCTFNKTCSFTSDVFNIIGGSINMGYDVSLIAGKIKICVQFSSDSTPIESEGYYHGIFYTSPKNGANCVLISTSTLTFGEVSTNSSTTRIVPGRGFLDYESYLTIGNYTTHQNLYGTCPSDQGNWMGQVLVGTSHQTFSKTCNVRGGNSRNAAITIEDAPQWTNAHPMLKFDNVEFEILTNG